MDTLKIDEIVEKYYDQILAWAHRSIPEEDAEDVTQNIFLGMQLSLGNFANKSSIKTWCNHIVLNQIADYYRKKHRYMEVLDKIKTSSVAKSIYNDFEAFELVQFSPARDRRLLWKCYIEKFSYYEIAKEEGISYEAARSRARRAVEYIRNII